MSSVTFPQETALTDEKQVLFNRFFPLSKGLALPAATLSVIRNDDSIFDDADSLIAIAQKSFANSAKKAVDENDRLRIPTHGSIGGKLVVHHSPKEYTL